MDIEGGSGGAGGGSSNVKGIKNMKLAEELTNQPNRLNWLNSQFTDDLTKLACHLRIKVPMHPGGDWRTVNRAKLIQNLEASQATCDK